MVRQGCGGLDGGALCRIGIFRPFRSGRLRDPVRLYAVYELG